MRKYLFRVCAFIFSGLLFSTGASALTLGPYSGQVVDSRTGEPIAGASVLIYWTKAILTPMGSDESFLTITSAYTDDKGGYLVPKISANLGLLTLLDSTYIIIYQPGYEAYIVREDFKEKENLVKLDRIPPDFDHKSHYKKITDFLWDVREYEDVYTGFLATDNPRMTGPILELREFLRRVEWEDRRDLDEDKR
jgi:hypothetical protein